jgi:AraC family transcriptional regulator of adaptative response / DNA-3-methyladenine glycosylase II
VADEAPELVCRAVQLIIAGLLDESGEEALGARLGVSARHLRRMFHEHLGVTPDQFARSRRAHFARRLLDDTDLGVAEIAFASGFGSLRQFNRAMREIFRASPRALRDRRRRGDRLAADGGLVLRLPFTPPYDWEAMSTYLRAHAVPSVESVEDGVYRRTISLDGEPGLLEIGAGGDDHLILRAHLPFWEGVIHVVDRATRLVGLDHEPIRAREHLAADADLGPLVAARPGIRVPGAWGPFEVAVQAVVRDRLAPDDATEALRKLVEVYGVPVPGLGHGLTHAFPGPEALTGAELVGPLAREVADGNITLQAGVELRSLAAVTSPRAAQEVALRLGARDAWPFGGEAEHLRPWRSLAAVYQLVNAS